MWGQQFPPTRETPRAAPVELELELGLGSHEGCRPQGSELLAGLGGRGAEDFPEQCLALVSDWARCMEKAGFLRALQVKVGNQFKIHSLIYSFP